MGQPIRKIILETHPEAAVKPIRTLLVDGCNLLRISMSDSKVNSEGVHYGGVFQFLLQLRILLSKTTFDFVYVFFDGEKSGLLRYEYYKPYKANRDKKYADFSVEKSDYMRQYEASLKKMQSYLYSKNKKNKPMGENGSTSEDIVNENFARERDLLLSIFNECYIRWIFDDEDATEGDDMISYYVKHKKDNELIYIVSTDEDITQLISEKVCVYCKRPKQSGIFYSLKNFKQEKGYPVENVLIKKVFCGDDSDNIGNIKGLSESKLFEMMPEMRERAVKIDEIKARAQEMIDERVNNKKKPLQYCENITHGVSNKEYDGDFYEINKKIIDLSSPLLTEQAENELKSMMYEAQDPEGRSFSNIYSIIKENKIEDIMDSDKFATFFEPFKSLADREIKYFKQNSK